MQSAASRIWTRVAVSISYNDNHYTTGTSFLHHGHLHLWAHPYFSSMFGSSNFDSFRDGW